MFVSTLRLSAAEVFADELVVLTIVPRSHTLTWTTLARKGRLRGLPLTSSSSAQHNGSSQSIVRWLEGCKCQQSPHRASSFRKLSAFSIL